MAEVKFDVKGPRWRVWSSKSFVPGWSGDWKVSVLNGAGETISEEMISMSSIPEQTSPVDSQSESQATPASETPAAAEPAVEEFQPPVNEQLMQ